MGREKVEELRKMFGQMGAAAGEQAGKEAAAAKAVEDIARRAAVKAAREKLLALAAKQKIKLNPDWKPTSLIAVINARSDLSDMDKVKLAAKAKMEGNLADLLPKKYKGGRELEDKKDELEGRLVFTDT